MFAQSIFVEAFRNNIKSGQAKGDVYWHGVLTALE